MFEKTNLYWSKIYLPPQSATIDYANYWQCIICQQKNITNTAICPFHNTFKETPIHIPCKCTHANSLWEGLQAKLQNDIILPSLTSQTSILGLLMKEAELTIFHVVFYCFLIFFVLFVCSATFSSNWIESNIKHFSKYKSISLNNLQNTIFKIVSVEHFTKCFSQYFYSLLCYWGSVYFIKYLFLLRKRKKILKINFLSFRVNLIIFSNDFAQSTLMSFQFHSRFYVLASF